MSRGNQREIDRQRAQARNAGKGTAKEGNAQARRENDAAALQAKVEAKAKREAAIAAGELVPTTDKKGAGGVIKKKDGSKK